MPPLIRDSCELPLSTARNAPCLPEIPKVFEEKSTLITVRGPPFTGIKEGPARDHVHSDEGLGAFYPEVIGDVGTIPPA